MYKRYFLVWSFGQHRVLIETNSFELERVLDNLRDEFEIHSKKQIPTPEFADEIKTFYIINYWGDEEIIGHISYPNSGDDNFS